MRDCEFQCNSYGKHSKHGQLAYLTEEDTRRITPKPHCNSDGDIDQQHGSGGCDAPRDHHALSSAKQWSHAWPHMSVCMTVSHVMLHVAQVLLRVVAAATNAKSNSVQHGQLGFSVGSGHHHKGWKQNMECTSRQT